MDTKNQDLDLINITIQKLLEERKNRQVLGDNFIEDDDDDQLLLSRLLSQLESLKSDTTVQQPEVSKEPQPSEVNDHLDKSVPSKIEDANESDGGIDVKVDTEEIVKELKRVRRQNSITHWLLSFVILLTVAWQISEVSLLWKVKNGLSHPFRHLGGMFTGMLRDPVMKVQDEEEKKNQQLEALSLPSFKMPELPYMDLTELSRSEDKH